MATPISPGNHAPRTAPAERSFAADEALLRAVLEDAGLDVLREMDAGWPFFAALISNAEMACAKADMEIARRYAALCEDDAVRERIWPQIEDEFALTCAELLLVTGRTRCWTASPPFSARSPAATRRSIRCR